MIRVIEFLERFGLDRSIQEEIQSLINNLVKNSKQIIDIKYTTFSFDGKIHKSCLIFYDDGVIE